MMDGYSVQEAATVLGVAEGRVWELLARGVLSGTPEGDSMRVFLKATASPMAPAPAREEPPKTNGNGGSHGNGGEVSAFRELLTEFRNLTERYGQALLALGEARGEVAGLRSRVELLEARLDLRLPPARDDSPITWGTVAPTPPAPEPPVAASVEPEMPAPAPVRRAPRPRPRKKPRSKKIAMTGFADALARAQDPSADLGALAPDDLAAEPMDEVVAAPAAAGIETLLEPAAEPFDTVEPSPDMEMQADVAIDLVDEAAEAVAAEPETEPEAAAPTYSAAVVEPDWFADGDFAWLDAADVEARTQPIPSAPDAVETVADVAPTAALDVEPEPMIAAEPEPTVDIESVAEAVAEAAPATEPDLGAEPEPMIAAEAVAESAPAAEVDLEPEPLLVEEAEPSIEEEAYAEPEPSVEPEPILDYGLAAEPEPMPPIEHETAAEAEPIASVEPDPPVVAAWGFRTNPQLPAEPAFLAGEIVGEAEPQYEAEAPYEAEPQPEPDTGPELMADELPSALAPDVPYDSVEPELRSDLFEQAEPVALGQPEPEPVPEPEPEDPGPVALGRRGPAPELRAHGAEEEVMWIGDDREAASEIESASRVSPVTPPRWDAAPTEPWPIADSAADTADSTRPPLAMTEEELAQLARDEGWNDAEVAAIRAMIQRPGSAGGGLPGGEELDEAIAALHAVPVAAQGEPEAPAEPEAPRAWAKSATADDEPPPYEDWTFELEPALDQIPPSRAVPRRPMPDPSRTRRRRGPAATAYRRLRRLFPS